MSQQSTCHNLKVESPNVTYSKDQIEANFDYQYTQVIRQSDGSFIAKPLSTRYKLCTSTKVGKTGVLLVGLGGNNGSTFVGGILANKHGISWMTKNGIQKPNYYGSMIKSSTVRLGIDQFGQEVYHPIEQLLPMLNINDIVVHGWDINGANLAQAMQRSQVFEYDLQRQLSSLMQSIVPLPSVYDPSFIASNQSDRADNTIKGSKQQQLDQIRSDISHFKAEHQLDSVIVLWTATTERFSELIEGLNDTADNILRAIESNESEISPSTLFAVASILEGCTYLNGSPQNTFVPAVVELAERNRVFIGGDDFKTGQTKIKSVMVDWLIGAGIKPRSIVSYNHLGNNDGKNLSSPTQFRSKEISKSNVIDDMVHSNRLLYKDDSDHPDHCVVIKYVPYVGDSKRAMDEYTSEIFMGGHNTIVMHNTCEDSLLAVPVMIDLVLLAELVPRIRWKIVSSDQQSEQEQTEYEPMHPVMSILSYLLKAPLVPKGSPIVNALFRQRAAIENLLKACIGLAPENSMLLEYKALNPSFSSTQSSRNDIEHSQLTSDKHIELNVEHAVLV